MSYSKLAYLFPGQGAQYSGMAMDLLVSDGVKKLFDTASEVIGKDIKELLQSDADTLKRTDVSQPAITAANLAAAVFLEEKGFKPTACAGFSLGEYAALVCAGIISTADCFRLVKARGEAMQKAAETLSSGKEGDAAPGMMAVVGLSPEHVESLIAKWRGEKLKDLHAANINSLKQVVVAGTGEALTEAEARFKEAGARRAIRLQVAGPFHSPFMKEAVDEFVPTLEKVFFQNPKITIFSNVTGQKISSGPEAKKLAVQQITCPVRWVEEEAAVAASGAQACFEVGPGKVLQGLWKDTGSEIPVFSAGTAEDIGKL